MKRKLNLFVTTAFAAVLVFFAVNCIAGFDGINVVSTYDENPFMPTIVIDAGHGGIDGGAVGVHGENEKDINLSIALYLNDYLRAFGFDTKLIRDSDNTLEDSSAGTVKAKKTSDLKNRYKIAMSVPNPIFISVHQNHFSVEKYNGAQMFYGSKNILSESLADCLQESFTKDLQMTNNRQIKKITESVYLVYTLECPAVLAECGFLSNNNESELLMKSDYQKQVAFVLFRGIINYYVENYD